MPATGSVSMVPMVGTCVSLSWQILQLLLTAKGNKHEHKSLQSAVTNIKRFLEAIPSDGVSAEGNEVLKQLYTQLMEVHALLVKVGNMSTLVALIKAEAVRDDFLRTNRDLISTFSILAQGEQLLRGARDGAQDLKQINYDLQRSQSEFFVVKEAQHSRLMDMASSAKRNHLPEQVLQRDLLDELRVLPEVADLGPEELLSEFRALQELALASYNSQGGEVADDARGGDQRSKKKINSEMEEFLLQQVCAAIAASVHAATPEALLLDAPPDYVCPISHQLMVQPVVLVETGHTYEAAAIHKWLDSHDVCPVSGRKLSSKQTTPIYALKRLIADWAAAHTVTLPPAPVYDIDRASRSRSGGPAAAAAAAEAGVAAVSMHGSSQSAPGIGISIDIEDAPRPKGASSGTNVPFRCTRTRWAAAAIALLLLVGLAIGLAVGLPLLTRRGKGTTTSTGSAQVIPGVNGTAPVQNSSRSSGFTAPQDTPKLVPDMLTITWTCYDGWDIAGKNVRSLNGIPSLKACARSCADKPPCTFITHDKELQVCWHKTDWKSGPDGETGPKQGATAFTACSKIAVDPPDTGRLPSILHVEEAGAPVPVLQPNAQPEACDIKGMALTTPSGHSFAWTCYDGWAVAGTNLDTISNTTLQACARGCAAKSSCSFIVYAKDTGNKFDCWHKKDWTAGPDGETWQQTWVVSCPKDPTQMPAAGAKPCLLPVGSK